MTKFVAEGTEPGGTAGSEQAGFAAEDDVLDDFEDDVTDSPVDVDDLEDEEDDTEDSLTYSNGVIEKIVAMATREIPHVLGMKGNFFHAIQAQFGAESLTKGVTVDVTDDNRVIINLSVIIEYGCYAPAIFDDVKTRVTERLGSMTGLEVAGINMRIEDVVTRAEYDKAQRHLIDNIKEGSASEGEKVDETEGEAPAEA